MVPVDGEHLVDRVEDTVAQIRAIDWKLQDVVVSPVREIDGAPDAVLVGGRPMTAGA